MARVKKNTVKKKTKAIRFQMGWGGLTALVISTMCVLLWTFIMGFWVGQKLIGRGGVSHKNLTVLNKIEEATSAPQVQIPERPVGPAFPPITAGRNTPPLRPEAAGDSAENQPLPTEVIGKETHAPATSVAETEPESEKLKKQTAKPEPVKEKAQASGPKAAPAKTVQKAPVEKEVKKQATAKTYFVLQIASYRDKNRAEKEAARWRKKGITSQVARVSIKNKGIWYRVYLGRYRSVQDATAGAKRLARKEGIRSYVVPVKP